MPNYIPYLVLVLFSIAVLYFLMLRKRSASPLILMLVFSGMVYFFEFFVMVLYESYEYFPGILPISYYDHVLGAVISNLLSVPVIASAVSVFQLTIRWIVFFAFLFGGIQWIFIRLEIYQDYWWSEWLTILSLLFFFSLAKWWAAKLNEKKNWCMFLSLFMLSWSLAGTAVYSLILAGYRTFHLGYFEDVHRDDIFTSAMYGFFKAFILAWFVYRFEHVKWKALSLLCIIATNILLLKFDIIRVWVPLWQYWLVYIPCCLLVLYFVIVSHRFLQKNAV